MARINRRSFISAVGINIGAIPRAAIAGMFGVAIVFALVDVAQWDFRWPDVPTALWTIAPYALLVSSVEYLAVTGILETERSVPAYLRFAVTSGVVLLPIGIAFGLLFAAPVVGKATAVMLFAIGVLIAIAMVAILPAWPIAQAFSGRLVAPTRIIAATRGFRWGLIGAAAVLSAINRQQLLPPVKDAHDLGQAFSFAAGEAGINALSMMFTASIAATAFVFAAANDERLALPE